jgi:superfamily II DNA or RNA helicase
MELELWSHQKKILDKNPSYTLLAHFPGGGKSLTLKELVRKNAFSVLILCPKSLVAKWEKEAEGIGVDYKVLSPYWFKEYHKTLPYYDAILIDEADSPWFGNNKSSKALFWYLKKHNPPYLYMGTATPYRSTPLNIYNAGRLCQYMPMKYPEFRAKFFYEDYFGWQPKMKSPDPAVKEQTQIDLYDYMSNFADVVRMEDAFDVPEQIYSDEYIEVTDKQSKTLKKLDEYSENRASFFRYAHEIENGWLDAKGLGEEMHFESPKVARTIEIVDQHKTAVVFALYRHQQQALYEAIKKKYPKSFVALINSKNSQDAPQISEELELVAKGEHPTYDTGYIIASVGVAAGWQCGSVPIAVYASLPWSYQQWVQSQGRILRGDNLKKNVYKVLLSGPVDNKIWFNLKNAEDYDPVKHAAE